MFFRSAKQVTAPQLVTARSISQQLLLEHAAQIIHSNPQQSSTKGESEIEMDDLPAASHPETRQDMAFIELFHIVFYLRQQLLWLKNTLSPVPSFEDLLEVEGAVPHALYNFLAWMFCGDMSTSDGALTCEEKVAVQHEDAHCCIVTIAEDIVHVGTKGRVHTPKHFMLPLTVQHLTRSSQPVTVLNHLGHGYSGSWIEDYETAIAE